MMKGTIRNPYAKRPRPSVEEQTQAPTSSSPNVPPAAASRTSNDSSTSPTTSSHNNHETASALVIAASDKAGMEGIDRKRIDAIILRESGNSLYMQQQRRRDENVNQRIANLKDKLDKAPTGWERDMHKQLNAEIPKILAQRPTRSTAVVVDM